MAPMLPACGGLAALAACLHYAVLTDFQISSVVFLCVELISTCDRGNANEGMGVWRALAGEAFPSCVKV